MSAPMTESELQGKHVLISALAFQDLCQAIRMLEQKLQDDDTPELMDYAKDPNLGFIHQKLMLSNTSAISMPPTSCITHQIRETNTNMVVKHGAA